MHPRQAQSALSVRCCERDTTVYLAAYALQIYDSRITAEGLWPPVLDADNDAGHSVCQGPADGVMRLDASNNEAASMKVDHRCQLLPCWGLWLVYPDRKLGSCTRNVCVLNAEHLLEVREWHPAGIELTQSSITA